MVRKRWQHMHFYKIRLETKQIYQMVCFAQTVIQNILNNRARVKSTTMPGTGFSRN
jgi:hypothetical protein